MVLNEEDFNRTIDLISSKSGILPRETHAAGIRHYIEKRMAELSLEAYFPYLLSHTEEIENLINGSTINETYFFREEKQFEFLRDKVFPEHKNFNGNRINIWSAACSTGEEAYSLSLLAKACNMNARLTASDINTKVLDICKSGIYKKNSIRTVDGAKFHHLLEPFKNEEGSYTFSREIINSIELKKINLTESFLHPEDLPLNQHVIFVRNVFIYFSREMREKILKVLAQNCLCEGGFLFVSMNEIAGIDTSIIPVELKKCMEGNIFYFKKTSGEKS